MDAQTARTDRVDLVLKGGGVKGVAMAGTLAALEEAGVESVRVAGASAGAIAGALHAAGYTAAELRSILAGLDFEQFLDRAWEDKIPLIGRGVSVLLDLGIYEGHVFERWLAELLADKDVETFGDLPAVDPDDRFDHRFQVIVSDVSARRLLVLPRDAALLGFDPDELNVARAVRMSMSIPIFFEPVRVENPETGVEHVLVDGGMLSNFPVWLFDTDGPPRWPTLGLMLVDGSPGDPIIERLPGLDLTGGPINRTTAYVKALVSTMMEAHDRLHLDDADFVRTIPIPNLGVATTQFDLDRPTADALYDAGLGAGRAFLDSWDFDAYVAEFRSGADHPGRTLRLASQLRAHDA